MEILYIYINKRIKKEEEEEEEDCNAALNVEDEIMRI